MFVKHKQSNTTFNVMYSYNRVPVEGFDSVAVSYVEILSVSIIVAPGLRANHSAVDIEFLEIVSIKILNIIIFIYYIIYGSFRVRTKITLI